MRYLTNYRPTVYLLSEPNTLAVYLIENLLANLCKIKIFSDEKNQWKNLTKHLVQTDAVEFLKADEITRLSKPDYLIYVNLDGKDFIDKIQTLPLKGVTKCFAVTSRKNLSPISPIEINENLGLVYLGDLLGPRMELEDDILLANLIKAVIKNEKLKIGNDEKVCPIFYGDVAKLISKWLFSFGPTGEEVKVVAKEYLLSDLCKMVQQEQPAFRYKVKEKASEKIHERKMKTLVLNTNLNRILGETINWGLTLKTRQIHGSKKKKKPLVVSLVFLLLLLPYLLTFLSLGCFYLAKTAFLKAKFNQGAALVQGGTTLATIGERWSRPLVYIPILKYFYQPVNFASQIIERTGELGGRLVSVAEGAAVLGQKMLKDENYDLWELSGKMALDLDYADREISFLEGEMKAYSGIGQKKIHTFLQSPDFEKAKTLIKEGRKLASVIPGLLGEGEKKSYLLLLQNNMELRPTGGFIGSFAIVSFEDGKLIDMSVQDVYSADGQLKGHVEPPLPIKKYLGEANWFLRDSNWDPDFPSSAQKAEWFLDKELDIAVEGVVAVDLALVKDLVGQVGPIYLEDFQTEINVSNLYEKTQTEVENKFFPGSHKKASFLTALTRELLNELASRETTDFSQIARVFYRNLEGRHFQIFLHEQAVQKALANLGWDGSVLPVSCLGNCHTDWFGVVEANLGVNKANYYLTRNYSLEVEGEKGKSSKKLKIIYENKADLALANKGIYKVYLRTLLPTVSKVVSVGLKVGESLETLSFDENVLRGNREIGVYFEVLPGQKKELLVAWEDNLNLDFTQSGEYLLSWRKQAGLADEPLFIRIKLPLLTKEGTFEYNTLFSRDFVSRLYW